MTRKKNKPAEVRRAIEGQILNYNRHENMSSKSYNWKISSHTKDANGDKFVYDMIPIGTVVKARTQYGIKDVVVKKNFSVTGKIAMKAAVKLRRVTKVINRKISDYGLEL